MGPAALKAVSPRNVTVPATTRKPLKQKANVYQAEYLGSGTFKISKPKRRRAKRRQSALKNRRRGSRK
jgi:Mor family transcriptional regulator